MASSLVRTLQRVCTLKRNPRPLTALAATARFEARTYGAEPEPLTKSPFDSNIIRILRNEIEYQQEYAPPHQVNKFPSNHKLILFHSIRLMNRCFFVTINVFNSCNVCSLILNSIRLRLKRDVASKWLPLKGSLGNVRILELRRRCLMGANMFLRMGTIVLE